MQMPFINNNGDTAATLLDNAQAAHRALDLAIATMTPPHGRNYMNHDDYRQARKEYDAQITALEAMKAGYTAEARHIQKYS